MVWGADYGNNWVIPIIHQNWRMRGTCGSWYGPHPTATVITTPDIYRVYHVFTIIAEVSTMASLCGLPNILMGGNWTTMDFATFIGIPLAPLGVPITCMLQLYLWESRLWSSLLLHTIILYFFINFFILVTHSNIILLPHLK